MSNFITLTKDENTTWDDIKMELRDFIKKYLEEDKIIINKEIKNKIKEPTADVDKKIVDVGRFHHQLHHKFFECNYGNAEMPWDRWFGTFNDGSDGAMRDIRKNRIL